MVKHNVLFKYVGELNMTTDGTRDFFSSLMPHTKSIQERMPSFKPTYLVPSIEGFRGEHAGLRSVPSINKEFSLRTSEYTDKAREENTNARKVAWKFIMESRDYIGGQMSYKDNEA
jgi:hypothetical protein